MKRRHRIPGDYVRLLTPAQYRALGAVVELCLEPDGTVYVSARTLARALGMSPRSYSPAARLLRALVDAGALRLIELGTVGPNGTRKAAAYRLSWVYLTPADNSGLSARLSAHHGHSQSARHGHTKNPLRGSNYGPPPFDRPSAAGGGRNDDHGCYHPSWCGCPDCIELRAAGE